MLREWLLQIDYDAYERQSSAEMLYQGLEALAKKTDGRPLLHWAAECGIAALARWLLVNKFENVDVMDAKGVRAIHIAKERKYDELIVAFISHGADESGVAVQQSGAKKPSRRYKGRFFKQFKKTPSCDTEEVPRKKEEKEEKKESIVP